MSNSLPHAWTYALQSVHWHSCTVQSHALALFLIYFVYHYPWGWQNRDTLLKPSRGRRDFRSSSQLRRQQQLDIKSSQVDHQDAASVDAALAQACPAATSAERKRFLNARQGNLAGATKTLKHYLQWHQKHADVATQNKIVRSSAEAGDLDIWNEVCQIAMKASGEVGETDLPRVIRTHQRDDGKPLVDKQGHRIIQITPARMDVTLAKSSTYALAVALYLNSQLDRAGSERIVVCMDVRAGQGWPNTHAVRLVPFMQQTTTLLLSLFPERLHRCLLYPVPSSFLWVWKTISKVVDPLTREKICLMSGPNKIVSPPPFEQMYNHMEPEVAHHLEDARLAAFR